MLISAFKKSNMENKHAGNIEHINKIPTDKYSPISISIFKVGGSSCMRDWAPAWSAATVLGKQ